MVAHAAIIHLGKVLPLTSQAAYPQSAVLNTPRRSVKTAGMSVPLLFGLARNKVCRALLIAEQAVGSYPAFSPLPFSRRYAFCCTICTEPALA